MPGLVHLAHASGAQPFEQDVGTEDQFLAAVLEQLVDLVRRQPAAVDQFFRQAARVAELVLQFPADDLELLGFEQLVLAQGIDQIGGRGERHGETSVAGTQRAGVANARALVRS
jgi:hypothetical protein